MTKKSLGQHWLTDRLALAAIVKAAALSKDDTVLEIGPGRGSLTELLAAKAKQVVAVEKDETLAADLNRRLSATNLDPIAGDILEFDFDQLPRDYKVVANIPYYLTSNLLRRLLEAANPPGLMALLLQKEVAERIVAKPGQMSVLAFSVQYYGQPKLLGTVSKELFEPVPKVDSAIIQIKRRPRPYFAANPRKLFRLVKAGFGERRKQLRNSLAGGLRIDRQISAKILSRSGIDPGARAQELALTSWGKLYKVALAEHLL